MRKRINFVLAALLFAACESPAPTPAPSPAPTQSQAPAEPAAPVAAGLLSPEKATEKAPALFRVKMTTTKGEMTLEFHRDWAPNGVDRFYNLVKLGFFDNVAFFRVIDGFMAQGGINGNPAVAAKWENAQIPDDPATGHSNTRGAVTFATGGPNTRTTQFFINFGDNSQLDSMGFTPIGKVVEGDAVLNQLYRGYGDGPPNGRGPDQGRLQGEGNAFLKASFPQLDYIVSAKIFP